MSVQDILNNAQLIGSLGNYQVAPKLPALPKPINITTPYRGISINQTPSPVGSALDRLMNGIKSQESGGNYRATNPSGASGAYQVLRSNFEGPGGWDQQALGHDVTYNQFMNTPSIQDAIARYELNLYMQKYGINGAIAAWYGGPGAVKNMNSTRTQAGGYPSISAYIKSVLSKM